MSKWLVSCYEGLGAQQLCCRKLYICFQEGVFWWTRWRTVRRMSELSVNMISYKEQKLAWGKTIISTMKGQYTLSMTKALFTLQPLKPGWNQRGVNTLPPGLKIWFFNSAFNIASIHTCLVPTRAYFDPGQAQPFSEEGRFTLAHCKPGRAGWV